MKTLTIRDKVNDVPVKVVEKIPIKLKVMPLGGWRSVEAEKNHNRRSYQEKYGL